MIVVRGGTGGGAATITSGRTLRNTPLGGILGEPTDLVRAKISDRLNALTRRFVDRSPFMLLATFAADGTGE